MNEFEFTLKFKLPQRYTDTDAVIEALASGGCTDAVVGLGLSGRIALTFTRNAKSALDAVASASADVKRAIPGAKFIEATPDLVGLTDLADIIGCSRQNMRKLVLASGPGFPSPIHDGKLALWRLAAVLAWLKQTDRYDIDEQWFDVARVTRQLNISREVVDLNLQVDDKLRRLVS
ncbi:MAG: DNA-binding protein [Gammaproteobacteria bacterium]|nr:DNA-binding protein [Gammaproteobacteria bacterium]NND39553.1 DNA-binding protein [Pseudomonadales bacterium]RZV52149.1 MAG: DNA-binding protein [Pseudomonadales bacterium]